MIQQAQQLLHRGVAECGEVHLGLNVKKTKDMFFHVEIEPITTTAGHTVEQAITESKEQDFKQQGSWTKPGRCSESKAQAWQALNQLGKLSTSDLPGWLKIRFLKEAVEIILLYGCATWFLTKTEKNAKKGTQYKLIRQKQE